MKETWINAAEIAQIENWDKPDRMKHALEAYEAAKRADTAGTGARLQVARAIEDAFDDGAQSAYERLGESDAIKLADAAIAAMDISELCQEVHRDLERITHITDVTLGPIPSKRKEAEDAAERVMRFPLAVYSLINGHVIPIEDAGRLLADAKTLASFIKQYGGGDE